MTAPVLADRGLLAALAIAYDQAGMRDRTRKLQHAGQHVGRVLTSTSELTADEARNLRRHLPRCSPECPALVDGAVRSCDVCGAPMMRPTRCSTTQWEARRFCSRTCSHIGRDKSEFRPKPQPAVDRFWPRVERRGPEECWPWIGAVDSDGYGKFSVAGNHVRAHRFAYEQANGPIEDGLWVLHSCDNPPCCNPAHLRSGTHDDNVADKMARGRQARGPELAAATRRGWERSGWKPGDPVMRNGQPNPTGTGPYCLPGGICWCGSCPWWKPAPEPNYTAATAGPDTRGRS